MIISRRSALIGGVSALFCAPAIVRAENIMQVKAPRPEGLAISLCEMMPDGTIREITYGNYQRIYVGQNPFDGNPISFPTCISGEATVTHLKVGSVITPLKSPTIISPQIQPIVNIADPIEWN